MSKFILITSLVLLGNLSAAVPSTALPASWTSSPQNKPEYTEYVGWGPDYHDTPNYINDVAINYTSGFSNSNGGNITGLIPVIETKIEGFIKVPDVAQYGGADWSGVVGIAHDTTVQQAAEIARENPEITYFFYMTGGQMVLNTGENGTEYRVFKKGDAVFFSGEPWWGSAHGYSNGYIKE